MMDETKKLIFQSLKKVEKWVEDHDYKGYEPFDGLSSFLRPLTLNNLFLERLLQQLVRQSPTNLRPVLGIKPQDSTKGRGYMAWGYLKMFKATGEESYRAKAEKCLGWLIEHKSFKFEKLSWGNHFDFSSRSGKYEKHEPIVVWTALIGQAFLDAFEILGDQKYLEAAVSVCDWILALPRERTDSGICVSYLAFKQSSIHNSNMLAAAMLAKMAKHTDHSEARRVAKEAMEYSCKRQLENGGWYYAEDPSMHWIDNFHTGYNLDSLKCYIENTGDRTYEANLRRGFEFFQKNFFEENGKPKYYHNRTYPVDSQCASQAIETLANFSDHGQLSLELAKKVAKWTIEIMQDKDGHFYYRQYPLGIKAKTAMLHWGQATMYRALSVLYAKL
jgi:rhamnogalacturonyl hydrolase YesR